MRNRLLSPYISAKIIVTALLLTGLMACEDILDNPPPRERPIQADRYEEYEHIPGGNKRIILDETYAGNTNKWPVFYQNGQSIQVINGKLTMYSLTQELICAIPLTSPAKTENFEIDFELTFNYHSQSWGYERAALLWNYQPTPQEYNYCEITRNRTSFGLEAGTSQSPSGLISFYNGGYANRYIGISPDGINRYRVRKINKVYYFFINGEFLDKTETENSTYAGGQQLGFMIKPNVSVSIDNLKVSRLNL